MCYSSCNKSTENIKPNNLFSADEEKITSIIDKMSIEEKVGQTCQITLEAILSKDIEGKLIEPHQIDTNKLKIAIEDYKVGSFLNVSNHTFTQINGKVINTIQEFSARTNHKIPVIYGVDAIHGATYIQNSTLFSRNWPCCNLGFKSCKKYGGSNSI